ncbi:unnamed protein product [Boreogadus saida]
MPLVCRLAVRASPKCRRRDCSEKSVWLLLQAPIHLPPPLPPLALITDPQPSAACAFEERRQQLDYS